MIAERRATAKQINAFSVFRGCLNVSIMEGKEPV
jgi:hypothetical protein